MHELSLLQPVFAIIEDYAHQHQFQKVLSVKLQCGCLSGIEPSCLRFAFDAQSRGTIAEGAHLDLEILPARIYCFSCEQELQSDYFNRTCPRCQGSSIFLTGGTEGLTFLEIDVE